MDKIFKLICIISVALYILFIFYTLNKTSPTVKYFPIDDTAYFTEATSMLQLIEADHPTIHWNVSSHSNETLYLRQDISLLYENGIFKGIMNEWHENVAFIKQKQTFKPNKTALLQTISFHHGEIHSNNESAPIYSIQEMTDDSLYIIKNNSYFTSFKVPNNKNEQNIKRMLTDNRDEQLQQHWDELIQAFQINKSNYFSIPLTSLASNQLKRTMQQELDDDSERHIGQLWEGLYKHYVIPLLNKNKQAVAHFEPIILLAKDGSHLYVLYELDGKKEKLLQQL